MRARRALRLAGALLCLGALTGFARDASLMRAGPTRPKHVKVGIESRAVLAQRSVQRLPLPLEQGCELRLGVANTSASSAWTVRAEVAQGSGALAPLFRDELAPGSGWRDVLLPITAQLAGRALQLSVSGAAVHDVYWSQPLLTCPAPDAPPAHPNVLLISLDTLRADRLGAYGNSAGLTARLDRLAREGTVFTQAYSHYPNTLVSHASLFTSLYPTEHGLLGGPRARLSTAHQTLASALAQNGYATAAFTEDAFVGSGFGFDQGFDRYSDGVEGDERFTGQANATFAGALQWLRQRPDAPFFLFVHTYQVHTPYTPAREALERLRARQPGYEGPFQDGFPALAALAYNAKQLAIEPAQLAWIEGLYDAETWSLDRELASFFDALEAVGALQSTLVVVLADHGEELGEHGFIGHGDTLHEQALRVPLIVWGKGLVPAGQRIDSPVGLIDVAPTIASLIGLPGALPHGSGRSLAHWVHSGLSGRAEPVVSELSASYAACPPSTADATITCPHGGLAIRDASYAYVASSALGVEQLFDRTRDLEERHDLASERPQVLESYRALAARYRKRSARSKGITAARIDASTERRLRALGYVH